MNAPDIKQARGRAEAEPVYLVEITPPGDEAPIMRFATRQVSVGGFDYECYLMGVSCRPGGLRRADSGWLNSTMRLWFSNEPWRGYAMLVEAVEDYPLSGALCVLRETYMLRAGAKAEPVEMAEPVEIFRGLLDGPAGVEQAGFYSDLTGMDMRQRKFIRR